MVRLLAVPGVSYYWHVHYWLGLGLRERSPALGSMRAHSQTNSKLPAQLGGLGNPEEGPVGQGHFLPPAPRHLAHLHLHLHLPMQVFTSCWRVSEVWPWLRAKVRGFLGRRGAGMVNHH